MTNTILDDAEARIAPAAVTAKATRQAIIEEIRREIGQQNYEEAKVEVPKLEKLLAKEIRPYIDRLSRLSQHAPAPLPPAILAHVRELQETCASGTNWVQEGLQEWDLIVPPYAKGSTRELDLNRRAGEIGSIRMKLRNWSGRESRMRDLMASINNYIQDSGWPMAQTVGSGTIVSAREESRELVVERAI